MILFENVGLFLNNTEILSNISFEISKGEFVFLSGPSGAGKTSILKLIHLDMLPTAGNIILNGENTRKIKKKKIPYLRRSLGFIFQDYKLLRDKTAYENVAFALEVTGAKSRVVKQKAMAAISTVGLSHRTNHYPLHLSGGECQRIAIARAIVQEPLIMLADEPTGNLDSDSSEAILELLESINRSGTAVLMATHHHEFTGRNNSRIIRIENGRIVE
jgi:cell division transport system ATP-binding protein